MKELPLPLVSIIVPCHNKSSTIKATIDSIKVQTLNNFEVIIVNDSSDDDSESAILTEIANDKRFRYEKVTFGNVALVRNHGFSLSGGLYICPLDGDDKIAPKFLETCIKAMREDRSIAIAYTGLWFIKPDGEEGLSPWPEQWDYDKQLQGKNQIPTCNVAKREVWERLGGQRSRYAPAGCGEEDAEMWLRAGAYGFKAKKVTDEGLFIYSWLSGQVSGNKEHQVSDWRSMAPWVTDGGHPFASYATPKRHSHAVSQYDRPDISVIIPVGPGHEREVINALDSLEMQHFRKWEAVVINDTGNFIDGDTPERIQFHQSMRAYPYTRGITTGGKNGAGVARNLGVRIARAPLIFFLDADDVLADAHAFDKMLAAWNQNEAIIYSDYVGKAQWDYDSALREFGDKLLSYNTKKGTAVFSKQAADYDPDLAQRQPEHTGRANMPYYHWCLVSVLMPKAWHDAIGGFDEAMETWEDVEYMWRLARAGYCFYRVPEPLVMYSYIKGSRREASAVTDADSLQKHHNLIQYIRNKFEGLELVACGCAGSKRQQQPAQINGAQAVTRIDDTEMVKIEFDFPGSDKRTNYGKALISPTGQINPLTGKKFDYNGYGRNAGDRFLVHVADQRARPDLFKIVSEIVMPEQPKVELAPPESIVKRGRKKAAMPA